MPNEPDGRCADDSTSPPSLVPIEQLPLGARVPTKNPKPWEYDDSLPEPDQSTWGKISITMFRSDGGIVDAELLRPQSWIARHKIVAGQHLPMNIEEHQVHGSAFVTAVDDCPRIASGEVSVVTARFSTREVNSIVRAEIVGPDRKIEVIEGTPIHPIWSVDRNDWVPLGDLAEGESLQGLDGLAVVLSITLSRVSQPVYNLEVHGEHVYQVGELGVLVHNSTDDCLNLLSSTQRKTYYSLQNNITEHYRKLADYVANPEAFDNLGILKNAPNAQVRQSIIDGRIRHLTQEIRNWENQLARMISGG